jgi:hypothetical protein
MAHRRCHDQGVTIDGRTDFTHCKAHRDVGANSESDDESDYARDALTSLDDGSQAAFFPNFNQPVLAM